MRHARLEHRGKCPTLRTILAKGGKASYPALSVIVATVTCGHRTLLKIRITTCEYCSCRNVGCGKKGSIAIIAGFDPFVATGGTPGMRTHSIQKVALACETKALALVGFSGTLGFGIPRNGMFPMLLATPVVESWIVIVPRISWPAIASRNTELGSLMDPWNSAGNGPVLCEPVPSLVMSTSGTMCSLLLLSGGGTSTGWIPSPSAVALGGLNVGRPAMGKMEGIFGGPGTGVVLGVGPCISTVTPCGMLPMRTMVGPLLPSCALSDRLAGTFMNSPGSMWRACPAVSNGDLSAS